MNMVKVVYINRASENITIVLYHRIHFRNDFATQISTFGNKFVGILIEF